MKILENSNEYGTELKKSSFVKQAWLDSTSESDYYCRFCGSESSIMASYSETRYGTACVTNVDGELDDYDSDGDCDNFQVESYTCKECGEESNDLSNLIIENPDEGWAAYKAFNHIEEEEEL